MKKKILLVVLFIFFSTNMFCDRNYTDMVKEKELYWEKFNISFEIISGNIDNIQTELLPESLFFFSKNELRLLRNIYYAQYGKIFNSIDLAEYYEKWFSWYEPLYYDVDSLLTKTDHNNIDLIRLFELGYEGSSEFDLSGKWRAWDLSYQEGNISSFEFEGNKVCYRFPPLYLNDFKGFEGTYQINEGFLEITIDSFIIESHAFTFKEYEPKSGFSWSDSQESRLELSESYNIRLPIYFEDEYMIRIGGEKYFWILS